MCGRGKGHPPPSQLSLSPPRCGAGWGRRREPGWMGGKRLHLSVGAVEAREDDLKKKGIKAGEETGKREQLLLGMQGSFLAFKAAEVVARRLGTPTRGRPAPRCGGQGGQAAAAGGWSLAGSLTIRGAGAELIPSPGIPGLFCVLLPSCPAQRGAGGGRAAGGAVPSRTSLMHSRVPCPGWQTQPPGPRASPGTRRVPPSPPSQPHRAPAEPQTRSSRWSGARRGQHRPWPGSSAPCSPSARRAAGNRWLFPREAQSQAAPALGRCWRCSGSTCTGGWHLHRAASELWDRSGHCQPRCSPPAPPEPR